MKINFVENISVRRSEAFIAGQQGLPQGHERYIAKGGGLIGLEIFSGDEISIKNIATITDIITVYEFFLPSISLCFPSIVVI